MQYVYTSGMSELVFTDGEIDIELCGDDGSLNSMYMSKEHTERLYEVMKKYYEET